MKIALDAAGGDLGVGPNVEAAVEAVRGFGLSVILVGPEPELRAELQRRGFDPADPRLELVHAAERVGSDEDPARACREKPGSSIMAAARLAAEGRAEAVVSAGPPAATQVAALWHLKRLPGVLRPAMAVALPTLKGTTLLLDAGANADCKPWHLLQFAAMGALYAQQVLRVPSPTVGLLSPGAAASGGGDLFRETLPLLKHGCFGFVGPVEGRALLAGAADVVVCDGFAGSVAVTLAEGLVDAVFRSIEGELRNGVAARLGGALSRQALAAARERFSAPGRGAAPLLGVGKAVVAASGPPAARSILGALRMAGELAASETHAKIRAELERMKSSVELSRVLD